jgi:hypothetical protein
MKPAREVLQRQLDDKESFLRDQKKRKDTKDLAATWQVKEQDKKATLVGKMDEHFLNGSCGEMTIFY